MAAGATYEPIATNTLSTAAASITFSSIAASWTDLRLVVVATANTSSGYPYMQLNSDTTANYSFTGLEGDGTSVVSASNTARSFIYTAYNYDIGTTPALVTYDIFSYAGSTYKTILSTYSNDKNGTGEVTRYINLWRSTSAITSIKFYLNTTTPLLAAGTIATLYGIKAA